MVGGGQGSAGPGFLLPSLEEAYGLHFTLFVHLFRFTVICFTYTPVLLLGQALFQLLGNEMMN